MHSFHMRISRIYTLLQRMKAEGRDILRPSFSLPESSTVDDGQDRVKQSRPLHSENICMTKAGVDRKISAAEIKARDKAKPWVGVQLDHGRHVTLTFI